ncbi:hypothetical protein ACOSQ2_009225 [Xanthoceras sorbifolium]
MSCLSGLPYLEGSLKSWLSSLILWRMLQMSLVGLGVVICDWTKLVMAACSQRLGVPIAVDANGSARERDSCWLEKWSFHNVLSWIRQHL